MAIRSKKKNDKVKKKNLTATFNELYDRYRKVAALLVACITVSFWLGTYYEEVKKERELLEMENKHSMELLNMKEDYMNKYMDMREKYLSNENDSTHENKTN